jgi:hypothetical protein
MYTNKLQSGVFSALLLAVGLAVTGCGGSSATPAPVQSASGAASNGASTPQYSTASCNSSGATSASITSASVVGAGTISSPAVGGCSLSLTLGTVFTNATAGTYSGTISLTAPAGLPPMPATNTCGNNCGNNAPPAGFSPANFVPLFYTTFQVSGYVGSLSENNPAETITVNSLTPGSNTSNFYTATWQAQANGATPPDPSTVSFTGYSNNDSATALTDVPLTLAPPNTLSLPEEDCPASSGSQCAPNVVAAPGVSLTVVTVVGYFT